MPHLHIFFLFFFFNDPPPPEISPLPLHAALPIFSSRRTGQFFARLGNMKTIRSRILVTLFVGCLARSQNSQAVVPPPDGGYPGGNTARSEEHTSELQSPCNLVCRLLLEKKHDPTPRPPARNRVAFFAVTGDPVLLVCAGVVLSTLLPTVWLKNIYVADAELSKCDRSLFR